MTRHLRRGGALFTLCLAAYIGLGGVAAEPAIFLPSANFAPYNLTILEGGVGVVRPLSNDASLLDAGKAWSLAGWLRMSRRQWGEVIASAIGEVASALKCIETPISTSFAIGLGKMLKMYSMNWPMSTV